MYRRRARKLDTLAGSPAIALAQEFGSAVMLEWLDRRRWDRERRIEGADG
jgi:hypothetical protein